MASITMWTRVEPRTRAADMSPALSAQTADPAWFLARQWQLGEFQGEDTGSPVSAELTYDTAPLTRVRRDSSATPQTIPRSAVDAALTAAPLPALVEREPDALARDLRTSVEAGRHLLRLLSKAELDRAEPVSGGGTLRAWLHKVYPLAAPVPGDADPATATYLSVLGGRTVDGYAVADTIRTTGGVPPGIPTTDALRPRMEAVFGAWLEWYRRTFGFGAPAATSWRRDRMEHRFALSAAFTDASLGEVVLTADEYDGNGLDWQDLDHDPGATLGASPESRNTQKITVIPTVAAFGGMANPRWWEFEDAKIHWGGTAVDTTDLARMLLIEYAAVYAGDHFVIPVELPIGSVTSVRRLRVVDSFGEEHLIGDTDDGFALFRNSHTSGLGSSPHLVLLPTSAGGLNSAPVEEVVFLRDETNNMAWAVETTVTGPAGHPVDRHEAEQRALPGRVTPAESGGAELVYSLQDPVPEHWIPLTPVQLRPGVTALDRLDNQRPTPGGYTAVPALGRVLDAPARLLIPEEEVPAEGTRVTRHWRLTRWADGTTHLWLTRAKRPARPQPTPALAFDHVTVP
ncbi:hypothetical protein [Sinosporangium siamense]|uniref:Uncharacterized protein n=1 Tax=Sinosporangium siamense TaxID=1367973 RepID=A0A919RS05_9ACTN|nr:hypothetical protein [Sinosporangium siamense]GII97466.1 hypothetical protein Ssi02_76970 [Sinosporangium siamense]